MAPLDELNDETLDLLIESLVDSVAKNTIGPGSEDVVHSHRAMLQDALKISPKTSESSAGTFVKRSAKFLCTIS